MSDASSARPQDDAITLDASSSGERRIAAPDRPEASSPDVARESRYLTSSLLGQGGMGDVRLAVDRRSGRDVALKIVRSRSLAGRLLREAGIQAQLEHPGIVPIFDVGRRADGRVYFAMKRVEGVDLDEVLRRVRAGDASYPLHTLVSAFLRVCLTVAYAHARGVLHRDLKPSNVMLGAYREVYVLDWGISKPGATEESEDHDASSCELGSALTVTGVTLGTPAYMSPERLAGAPADERSDVFALGAILFEILALEPLLDESQVAAGLRRKLLSYDARPSRVRPEVPPELDAICLRATALSPSDRFPSARALHDAVAAHVDADRDDLDRQRLAAEHEARAADAMDRGNEAEALAEVGQALALDPESPATRARFGRLMRAQRSPPAAVLAEVDAQRDERAKRMTPSVVLCYTLAWLTIYPLVVLMAGVRSVALALAPAAAWTLAALVTYLSSRHPWVRRTFSFTGLAAFLAVALTTVETGPFFVLPHAAAAIVIGFTLADPKRHRLFVVGAALLSVLVPTLLAWSGIHDVYRFTADGLEVHGVVRATPAVFYFALTGTELAVVGFAFLYGSHYRALLDRAKIENAVVGWQLETIASAGPRREPLRRASDRPAAVETPVTSVARILTGHDRYERGTEIAPGTYRAFDRELAREVTLTIHDGPSEEKLRLAARILHPAIAPLYDLGIDDEGRLFSVSRVRRGRPLSEVRRLPAGLIDAFGELCLAVAFAHREGACHGALSPACVEIGAYGETELVGWTFSGTAEDDVRGLGAILRAMAGDRPAPELAAIADRAERGAIRTARRLYEEVEAYRAGERDGDLRLRLSRTHLDHAEAAARRALGGDEEARTEALREAGRALALGDRSAGELLLRLLATPPAHAPPEVVRRVALLDEVRVRRTRLITAGFSAFWFTLYPIVGWLVGIRDAKAVIILAVAWVLVELALLAEVRFGSALAPVGTIAMMVGAAACTTVVGPFFLVGVLVTVITMTRALTVPGRYLWLVAVGACAAIVVPTVLAWTGVHPIYRFEGDVMRQAGALAVDKTTGFLGLSCAHVLAIVFAARYAARFRDVLDRFEIKNMYVTWKLSRLLRRGPPKVSAAASSTARTSTSPPRR